jgi:hypothetical protein
MIGVTVAEQPLVPGAPVDDPKLVCRAMNSTIEGAIFDSGPDSWQPNAPRGRKGCVRNASCHPRAVALLLQQRNEVTYA